MAGRRERKAQGIHGSLQLSYGCCVQQKRNSILSSDEMKIFCKFGVSLLSLLMLATPIMACLVPAVAMSQSERDCCKRMAHECGSKGMPQSHSCCQTTTVADHLPAIKSSSDLSLHHPTLFVAYTIHPSLTLSAVSEPDPSAFAADIHSPPISPPAAISVLRI